jgi:NAD(P)-dependent dehydrogenase (short-subunit alcohol dehydrogenase family)
MKTLRGKQVVVTGAASGIGLETARAFARQGANLVVSDINGTALEGLRHEITGMGVDCFAQPCDVGSEASVAAFAAAVQAAVGPVDVLFNNAGIGYLGSFGHTPVAWWRHTFDVNVLGIVHLIQAFLPAMRAAGGERKVVNVASLAGVAPAPNLAAYAASKHAVVGLSEVLALELYDSPVSVLVVCPGIINTNIINVPGRTTAGISEAQIEKLRRYYAQHGCLPDVVAAGIVRSVLNDDLYLFVGPEARPASVLARVSRRLTRWMTIRAARKSGYLAEA